MANSSGLKERPWRTSLRGVAILYHGSINYSPSQCIQLHYPNSSRLNDGKGANEGVAHFFDKLHQFSSNPFSRLGREPKQNDADAENLLWSKLRRKQLKGHQFYRQKVIGRYIVDFYCATEKLVIEVDGGQHYTEEGKKKDRLRNEALSKLGLAVLRFSDREVLESTDGVPERIWSCLP
jgi:very-short-patch-repair endonuclease